MNKLLISSLFLFSGTIYAEKTPIPSNSIDCTVGNIPLLIIEFNKDDIALFNSKNVEFTFDVTPRGKVKNVNYSESSVPKNKLDKAVKRLQKYRFKIAQNDGQAYYQTNCHYKIK